MTTRNQLVLIRGLPGSGKSTLAAQLSSMSGYRHFEADMFLMVDGIYVYDASKVHAAHWRCFGAARQCLKRGENVVVANTFVKVLHMQRYIDLGFSFSIIEAAGGWTNTHRVPENRIKRMADRWEQLPSHLECHLSETTAL